MIRDLALRYGSDPALRASLTPHQRHALDAIASCGTEAAGLHRETCDACGETRLVPNTCGHRSCPHCQGRTRLAWVAARQAELLPCDYFHAVFTLPAQLRPLAIAYPAVVYDVLLRASSDAVSYLCRQPRLLGGEVGQLAVLHTWRRDLGLHPHVHLVVTAGGWDAARERWIPARRYGPDRRQFLLPASVLRRAFQFRLRRLLLDAHRDGAFAEPPTSVQAVLASPRALRRHLDALMTKRWVIRIEPPFAGPRAVLKYLGAYVNRVACGPGAIVAHDAEARTVTYRWRTNDAPPRDRRDTILAIDFLRRFLQHVPPMGFHRIRFRGLWATAHRATKLRVVQRHLADGPPPQVDPIPDPEPTPCPVCGRGHFRRDPGPCPRPGPAERRRYLALIRASANGTQPERHAAPLEAHRCA